jgi:hypothetical protein
MFEAANAGYKAKINKTLKSKQLLFVIVLAFSGWR